MDEMKRHARRLGNRLVGKSEDEAVDILKNEGVPYRIVERDGDPYFVTMDYKPNRMNLVITEGKVTEYSFG